MLSVSRVETSKSSLKQRVIQYNHFTAKYTDSHIGNLGFVIVQFSAVCIVSRKIGFFILILLKYAVGPTYVD